MKSHELAKTLLSLPDKDILASVDVDVGEDFCHKCYGEGIVDVVDDGCGSSIRIHFELGEYVDLNGEKV